MYALVDCNNFYASCERVFNPKIEGKPVIVLSNNDGCIIARSKEAKALGIEMGAPYFKARAICERYGVSVFSSNYQYYGDMSSRVMQTLAESAPEMEVYSIDEAFLKFRGFQNYDLTQHCLEIRKKVKKNTGLPVCIGIAPTKTLSKIANHIAKKQTDDGVFNLSEKMLQDAVLAKFPISDIWGVGRQWSKKLNALDIYTALDMRDASPALIRKNFTVVGQRINQELKGISCIGMEEIQPKKNIMSSRSFGKPVTELRELKEAISYYTARACQKLRHQNGYAQAINVFVRTNPFKSNVQQYRNGASHSFVNPTNDTLEVTAKATKLIESIFKKGIEYKKAGIMLMDLTQSEGIQDSFFTETNRTPERSDNLMNAMDLINDKYGNETIHSCAQGVSKKWIMNCNNRSPRYTTQWSELSSVN